jgi:hypothetical protein
MTGRHHILGFIGVWIAIQVLAPLQYYLLRDDHHDERFAWRMFSPTRMMTCDPRFSVDGQRQVLGTIFHEGWVEIAKRGRFVVLEAMGRRLCQLHPGHEVVLDLQCTTVDGKNEHWGGSDLCKFPDL